MARIVVRLDDIHPRMDWSKFDRFKVGLSRIGAIALIGVIPDCRDAKLNGHPEYAGFWRAMRDLAGMGWRVSQHGYTHVYDKTAKSLMGRTTPSEFAGHELGAQIEKLSKGKEILSSEGLASDVFMAPKHSFDRDTLSALKVTGFNFVTDGFGIWPYNLEGVKLVPQLMARPHGLPFGIYTCCLHLDTMTESSIDKTLERIDRHKVISFDEAANSSPQPLLASPARYFTEAMIRIRRS